LEKIGLGFQPDVVILEIFPLNDICNNSLELFGRCKSRNDRYRPYFVEANGDLRLTSAQPVRNFLRRHSVTYGLAEHALLKEAPLPVEAGMDPLVSTYLPDGDQPPAVAAGWKVTEDLIVRTARLAKQSGAQFIVMVAPFEAAVGEHWDDFANGFGSEKRPLREYPEQRLQRLFARENIPAVLLLDIFANQRARVLPYLDGHFNREGHEVAAEALSTKVKALTSR
jgi:hypothetical protein